MSTSNQDNSFGTSGDSGPTVRRMSPEVRTHARDVVLAETHSGSGDRAAAGDRPDDVTIGRTGREGTPKPLSKRWVVLATGLVVAAAAATIIVGSGVISGDDIGLSPADTTRSQDEASSNETENGTAEDRLDLIRTRANCLSFDDSPPVDASFIAYERQTEDYTIVAVADEGLRMCATYAGGTVESEGRQGSGNVSQFIRRTTLLGERHTELLGGKAGYGVVSVDVQADGEVLTSAHVQNGWFSALALTKPGADLAYVLTMSDGTSETVAAPASPYSDPGEQEAERDEFLSGLADTCFDATYELIGTYQDASYVFFAAITGSTVQGCVLGPNQRWMGSLPAEMSPNALIEPLEPAPGPTDKGPYPVMGRAAPNVTEVVVVLADGHRQDTAMHEGFYSMMLPATDAVDLTYVVSTADGEARTIESD